MRHSHHYSSVYWAALLILCGLASIASAQSAWTLTTADFHTDPVALQGLDAAGLHVAAVVGGAERVIPYEQFLELTRPLSPVQGGGKFTLHIQGGDHLGGEPIAIKGNNLLWNSPAVGEISLPMKRLLAVTLAGKPVPDTRKREDIVTLANGDTLHGIITALGGGKVAVQTDAGNSEAPLPSVASVSFASTAGAASAEKGFRVRFDDGSSLVAPALVLKGDHFELSFSKDATRDIALTHVAAIEQVNGPVSWLSTRQPAESVYTPYFGGELLYAARMDTNYKGEEIRFRDRRFIRGIGVHAYSRLVWDLDGSYGAFRTRYAIDGDGPLADVTIRVKLDDKVAYEKEHVHAGMLSQVVLLDLAGAKRITLEVDFGANGSTQDRLNWIEPALLRGKPTAAQ